MEKFFGIYKRAGKVRKWKIPPYQLYVIKLKKIPPAHLIDPAHLLDTWEYTFATSSWPFASIVNTDTKDGDYKFSNHASTKKNWKILKYDPSPKHCRG